MIEDITAAIRPTEPFVVRLTMAAKLIGISRTRLYELIGSGDIETIKIGRLTMIPTDSLKSFIERKRA